MEPGPARILRLLEGLARSDQPAKLAEIADWLQVPKSNAHRMVHMLLKAGFASQEPGTDRYVSALKLYELGMLIANRHPLKRAAGSHLLELQRATEETVALVVLEGTDILYVERLSSLIPIRATLQAGWRVPAVFTAAGQALLAFHSDAPAIVEQILREEPRASGLDAASLSQRFETIRGCGYAMTRSGWNAGVNSVAAPILSRRGSPAGAVALIGPTERMDDDFMRQNAKLVMNTCLRISETLGYL